MAIEGTFLRSRLARKVLLLFLVGSFLPLVVIAAVAYRQISDELYQQGWERLRQTSKVVGIGVLGRLEVADATLEAVGKLCAPSTNCDLGGPETTSAASGLTDIVLATPTSRSTLVGKPIRLPALTPARRSHLRTGRSLLLDRVDGSGDVLMARALDPADLDRGLVWGRLDPAILILGPDRGPEAKILAETCVFDAEAEPIFCPRLAGELIATRLKSGNKVERQERFEWQLAGDETYLAGVWRAFLAYQFGARDWIVVVSEPREKIFASVRAQQPMILLALLLSFSLVFLAGNVLVRRRLDPVNQLEALTRKVADGDFSVRLHLETRDELEMLAHSFNQMAEQLGSQFETLKALSEVDRAILSTLDERAVLSLAVSSLATVADASGIAYCPLDLQDGADPGMTFWSAASDEVQQVVAPRALVHELHELSGQDDWIRAAPDSATVSCFAPLFRRPVTEAVAFPVRGQKKPVGALVFLFSEEAIPTTDGLTAGRQLADQLSVALQNARLVSDLDSLSWGTLMALARTMDAKSDWTAGHSERVTELALEVGRALNLRGRDLVTLQQGALLHDIGKMGVPASVLDKPDQLETKEEIEAIRAHVEIGLSILEPISALRDVLPIVRHHHERWDGTGYPDGLAGVDIPLLARIISVVDVFDALVSPRPYRPAWPLQRALAFIREKRGVQFDPMVVDALLTTVGEAGAAEGPHDWPSAAAG